jgi:hypothetical protein
LFRQADVAAMVTRRVRDQRRARQPIGKHA